MWPSWRRPRPRPPVGARGGVGWDGGGGGLGPHGGAPAPARLCAPGVGWDGGGGGLSAFVCAAPLGAPTLWKKARGALPCRWGGSIGIGASMGCISSDSFSKGASRDQRCVDGGRCVGMSVCRCVDVDVGCELSVPRYCAMGGAASCSQRPVAGTMAAGRVCGLRRWVARRWTVGGSQAGRRQGGAIRRASLGVATG